MPTFNVIAVLEVVRDYQVEAITLEEALASVRDGFEHLPYDAVDSSVVDVMAAD